MKYQITSADTIRVQMGIRPCATPEDLPEDSTYRKAIPLTVDVTVKDIGEFDLDSLPKIIAMQYISAVKVDIQGVFRGKDKTKDSEKYKLLYDAMKDKLASVQTYTDTETKARAKAEPMSAEDKLDLERGKAIKTLTISYPTKWASIAAKFIADLYLETDPLKIHAITVKYASELEAKLIKKQ